VLTGYRELPIPPVTKRKKQQKINEFGLVMFKKETNALNHYTYSTI
jgi:hypothetical protein